MVPAQSVLRLFVTEVGTDSRKEAKQDCASAATVNFHSGTCITTRTHANIRRS